MLLKVQRQVICDRSNDLLNFLLNQNKRKKNQNQRFFGEFLTENYDKHKKKFFIIGYRWCVFDRNQSTKYKQIELNNHNVYT